MAEVQPKNTESTKWMTSYLPVAAPVTDEEGEEVPVQDALEAQRAAFKKAEENEKEEAEEAEAKAEEAKDEKPVTPVKKADVKPVVVEKKEVK